MKKILLTVLGILIVASAAPASYIDFTTSGPDPIPDFSPALGQADFSIRVDGVNLTFTAGTTPPDLINPPILWWDSTDGFGVQYSYEQDEIEGPEYLMLSFEVVGTNGPVSLLQNNHTPFFLEKVFISDLFNEWGYTERGVYQIGGPGGVSDWVPFSALAGQDIGVTNGQRTLDIYQSVHWITFSAPGLLQNGQNHEYALQGIQGVPVPVPPAVLLLGSGILGLVPVRRRMKR